MIASIVAARRDGIRAVNVLFSATGECQAVLDGARSVARQCLDPALSDRVAVDGTGEGVRDGVKLVDDGLTVWQDFRLIDCDRSALFRC